MVQASQLPAIRDSRVLDFETVARDIYSRNKSYVGFHGNWKNRISLLDDLADGKWPVVWPDNTTANQEALIADMISSDIADVGLLAGGVEPTVVCDSDKEGDTAQKEADLRRQVLTVIRERSGLRLERRRLAMDLAATGGACMVVWPDYTSEPTQRFPQFIRKDPRNIFPDPDYRHGESLLDMTVSYVAKARQVEAQYPGTMAQLFREHEIRQASNASVEVIEYYDATSCWKVAAHVRGEKDIRVTVLAHLEHDIGKPLVVFGTRPSFDGQIRGQFDSAIAPLKTANRFMSLMLAGMGRYVYAPEVFIGDWDEQSLQESGPDARYRGEVGAEAKRLSPDAVNPQSFAMYEGLIHSARTAAGIPSVRAEAQTGQAIASAQFVDRIQGKLTTSVADLQLILSDMEQRGNALALEVDEKMLGGVSKPISGLSEGKSFKRTYDPARDIKGKYDNRVEFGAGAGLDHHNREIAIERQMQMDLISKRTARTEILRDRNIQEEERQVAREKIEQSVLMGLLEPTTPIDVRLRAAAALHEGKSVFEMAGEVLASPELSPGQPEQQIDPALQQLAAERGGLPSSARNLPTPPRVGRSLTAMGIRRNAS